MYFPIISHIYIFNYGPLTVLGYDTIQYLVGLLGQTPHTEEVGSWGAAEGCLSAGGSGEEGTTSLGVQGPAEERSHSDDQGTVVDVFHS